MIKRHTTFYVNELKPINLCGKTVMWQMDLNGAYETPFKTQPTTGEHDFNICEGCQNTRKELIKRLTEKFNGTEQKQGFPFCCSHHSNLIKVKEFNRASFVPVPEMVADKIIYTNQHITNQHITNNHANENYYKDITDYIDYTVESFGQMPNSCGEPLYLSDYFFYVTDLLTRNTEISKERKNRLLEFLEAHQTPPTKNKNTDLNILLGTYQKWLKTFPFEISFFAELKPHFEKQLPILNGKPETNKYTAIAKAKMHTKGSLIDVLLNLTKNLLDKVNVPELRKQGAITDIQGKQLEFAEAELHTKTAEITRKYSNGELKYVKALKKWLQLHKDYFKEVAPLLKALPPQPINESHFSVLEWATIFYYADETKLLPENRTIKARIEQFINKYEIDTTFKYFKTQYYEAKKRINERNDYPINKLEFIIPFLKENYKQTVTKVENDIIFLEENMPEY